MRAVSPQAVNSARATLANIPMGALTPPSAPAVDVSTMLFPPLTFAASPVTSVNTHEPAIRTTTQQLEDNVNQSISPNPRPKRVTPSGVNATYGFVEGVGRGEQSYGVCYDSSPI